MRLFALFFCLTAFSEAKKHRFIKIEPNFAEDERKQMQTTNDFKSGDGRSSDKIQLPVPFGHIFKEGYEDPRTGFKLPIDLLELASRYVMNGPAVKDYIEKNPMRYISYKPNPYRKNYPASSTNEFKQEFNEFGVQNKIINDSITIRPFWDFESLLERNLEEPEKYRLGGGNAPIIQSGDRRSPTSLHQNKSAMFPKGSFELFNMEGPVKVHNFTNCDEFGKRAKFHPNDIVNTDWVPFYIWVTNLRGKVRIARIHRFIYPTKKFVQNYIAEYSAALNRTIDWDQPKLIMKDGIVEVLLVAGDRRGLFYVLPFQHLPIYVKQHPGSIPVTSIRLKIVDPYLGMMYCDRQYAVIMGISGTQPSTIPECLAEAAKLKMVGKGFPARRDLNMEAMEAQAKASYAAQRESQKIISSADQLMADQKRFL